VFLKIRERINLVRESFTSPAGARADPSRRIEDGRVDRANSCFYAPSRMTTMSGAIAPEFETAGFPVATEVFCKQLRDRMLK
jgi:hypothetical protein